MPVTDTYRVKVLLDNGSEVFVKARLNIGLLSVLDFDHEALDCEQPPARYSVTHTPTGRVVAWAKTLAAGTMFATRLWETTVFDGKAARDMAVFVNTPSLEAARQAAREIAAVMARDIILAERGVVPERRGPILKRPPVRVEPVPVALKLRTVTPDKGGRRVR